MTYKEILQSKLLENFVKKFNAEEQVEEYKIDFSKEVTFYSSEDFKKMLEVVNIKGQNNQLLRQ